MDQITRDNESTELTRGCCGRDRMVVGFTTTYAIRTYHHWCCEFSTFIIASYLVHRVIWSGQIRYLGNMIADGKVFQKTDSTPQASINEDMLLQNQVLVRHLIRNPAMMTMQEVEGKGKGEITSKKSCKCLSKFLVIWKLKRLKLTYTFSPLWSFFYIFV
jgi:hypothetical protein